MVGATRVRGILLAAAIVLAPNAALAARFIPMLSAGDAVPPIPLIAQDGHRFTFADFHGDAVLLSFAYTRCRDPRMCPLVTAKFAQAARAVGASPVRLVILTLDPAHDTPSVLRRYGRAFGQDPRTFTLATGNAATVEELTQRLGIDVAAPAPGQLVHTQAAIVIGPDGRIARTIFGSDWSSNDLLAAARATVSNAPSLLALMRLWLSEGLERCGGGPALRGAAVFAILAATAAGSGATFWLAFREKPAARISRE